MSNIIKNSSLSLEPKLIELTDLQEIKQSLITNLSDDDYNYTNELNALKEEGAQILKETEKMVFELLEKAREEAKIIILNAREEADVRRNEVFQEAEILREEARKSGYEEGLRLAHADIEADRQKSIQQNELIIEEARQTKLAILKSSEADIVRLVMAITKKVIANELSTNLDLIINIVRNAISHLDNPENVKVYVNPAELDNLLRLRANENLNDIGSEEISADIKGDARVTCGGCLVESENGSIDARIETKLEIIEKGLREISDDE